MKDSVSRRAFLGGSAGLVLGASALGSKAFAQSLPAPEDEKELYRLAQKEGGIQWYQTNALAPMQAVVSEFEKQYPGVPVTITRLTGPAQYARFVQESTAGKYIADVLLMGDYPLMKSLISEGHIASWRVPTRDRFADEFVMGSEAYCAQVNEIALIYRDGGLKPEEVELLRADWSNVLDPRFKGRFTASTMRCGGCYIPVHMFLDPKFSNKYGPEFLKKAAAQQPAVFSDFQVIIDRVVAGERDFSFWSGAGAAYSRWEKGEPIRWLYSNPTPVWANEWQSISKYSTRPAGARLFVNWWTSEAGGKALQKHYGSTTTMRDLPDTRKSSAQEWFKPVKDSYQPDWARWEANFDKDMNQWINNLTGKG